ncbi:MAG: hypothetical protein ACRCSB_03900 [Bacteroidales bacterium]
MKNQPHGPFQTPNGYFEQLPTSIMQRIVPLNTQVSKWTQIRSQLAFAASFALLAGLASLVLHLTNNNKQGTHVNWIAYSMSTVDVEEYVWNSLQEDEVNQNTICEETVINYLLTEEWIEE